MSKNIVICFDGTWNTSDAEYPTNVVKTAQLISPADKEGIAQVVFYDEGVGSSRVPFANTVNRLLGGAFGAGLSDSIERAYRFLSFNYSPGDRIFVFGFSRGAFGARSFCGLLRTCGVIDKEHIRLVKDAMDIYRERDRAKGADADACIEFRAKFSVACHHAVASDRSKPPLQVEYLGIWDTVGALGIPGGLPLFDRFNRRYEFHDHKLSSMIRHARHALAIDERRVTFKPTLWENLGQLNGGRARGPDGGRPYSQVWFPGDHASVGGGGRENGLWQATLVWVIEGAEHCGLAIEHDGPFGLEAYRGDINCKAPVDSLGGGFQLAALSPYRWRDGPDGSTAEDVAPLCVERLGRPGKEFPDGKPYRPQTLKTFIDKLGQQLGLSWS